jgi:putative SOS response-associated peptidase YedK
MVEQELRDTFHGSFSRCQAMPGFFDRFYEIFVAHSEEARERFKSTDMDRQVKVLANIFYTNKLALSESALILEKMNDLATIHDREHRDIRPELYDEWLDCLILTVSEFDHEYSHSVEKAWRKMMEPGINFMKSRY